VCECSRARGSHSLKNTITCIHVHTDYLQDPLEEIKLIGQGESKCVWGGVAGRAAATATNAYTHIHTDHLQDLLERELSKCREIGRVCVCQCSMARRSHN